jgi:hypothetical protein
MSQQCHAELQGLQIKDPDKSLQSVSHFPNVRGQFVALPSSAAVERSFSVGRMIDTSRRNRLMRLEIFETLLLLRINHRYAIAYLFIY